MSTDTPARYWAANTMYIHDVQTKIAEKATVKSSVFFCRQDPQLTTFQFIIYIGGLDENQLDVFVMAIARDVSNVGITFSLSNEENSLKKELSPEKIPVLPKNSEGFDHNSEGYWFCDFFEFSEATHASWRIVCEVEYEASLPMKPPNETCNKSLHDDLLKLLESSENSDFTFSVKGEKIKAHKTILVARSDYFKRMFDSGLEESVSKEVKIQDFEPDVITGMLQFLYSGLPPKNLADIAMGLLAASDKYGLDELKWICESNICSNLTARTVVDALLLAEQHSCEDLMARAQIVFRANIGAIKQSKHDREKLGGHDLLWNLLEDLLDG